MAPANREDIQPLLKQKFFGGNMISKIRSVCQQAGTTCAKRRGMTRGIRGSGWFLLAIAFLLMLPSRAAFAQYDTGSLIGVIQDSTGAVIPGVTVTAVSDATGVVYTGMSGSSGEYEIPNLHTGTYKVPAEHQGFSAAVANNVLVSVGVRQHIDLILKVGQTATTVEVSDVSLQVDTEDSERQQTVSGYQAEALPLVSRNFSDFLSVVTGSRQAPTAATTSSISSLVREGAYNVNGQRSMFNNYLLDGMDNNAYGESNQGFDNQIIAVPPDSVAQFSVVTNNESAEYGPSSGATINSASAGGSNRFHGTVYEFIRNTDLNAAGYFKPNIVSNTGSVVPFQKSTFNRNQFGLNFGGPIIRDKLFFFLDYEGFRQTLKPLSVLTLPTQNEINGILVVPVKNPLTGTTYAAGTPIPTSAINPLSQQLLTSFKQIQGLPVSGLPTTGLASHDYAVQAP